LPRAGKHIKQQAEKIEAIVIGCSAGGVPVIFDLFERLEKPLNLAIVVVVHRGKSYASNLEDMLADKTGFRVKVAEDKEELVPGSIYFAPADYHLLIEPDRTCMLDDSEPVFFCRPAIDLTLQSMADAYTENLAAILLSGANQDGAVGMSYVSEKGGITIIQDPANAEIDIMPQSAIALKQPDLILTNAQLIEFLNLLNSGKRF
jgi:two-component system, chemotaxis family, protein-glutamate methylesterase/glutaminase